MDEAQDPPPMGLADVDAAASRSLVSSTGLLIALLPAILVVTFVVAAIQGWGPL